MPTPWPGPVAARHGRAGAGTGGWRSAADNERSCPSPEWPTRYRSGCPIRQPASAWRSEHLGHIWPPLPLCMRFSSHKVSNETPAMTILSSRGTAMTSLPTLSARVVDLDDVYGPHNPNDRRLPGMLCWTPYVCYPNCLHLLKQSASCLPSRFGSSFTGRLAYQGSCDGKPYSRAQ